MPGKISDRQWEVLERLAEAERAAETVRQCWIPVDGMVDGHAVRALERAGLASTVPAEMMLLRRYAHLVPDLTGAPAPAETLWEALTEAHFDRDANRWRLQLDDTGLAGLAHAVHLEALVGGVTHRNRLRRAHDLGHPHPIPRRFRRRRLSGRGEPGVTGAVPADC